MDLSWVTPGRWPECTSHDMRGYHKTMIPFSHQLCTAMREYPPIPLSPLLHHTAKLKQLTVLFHYLTTTCMLFEITLLFSHIITSITFDHIYQIPPSIYVNKIIIAAALINTLMLASTLYMQFFSLVTLEAVRR